MTGSHRFNPSPTRASFEVQIRAFILQNKSMDWFGCATDARVLRAFLLPIGDNVLVLRPRRRGGRPIITTAMDRPRCVDHRACKGGHGHLETMRESLSLGGAEGEHRGWVTGWVGGVIEMHGHQ